MDCRCPRCTGDAGGEGSTAFGRYRGEVQATAPNATSNNAQRLNAVENERKDVIDFLEFPDSLGTDHQHADRLPGPGLVLGHDLPAGTAGCDGMIGQPAVDAARQRDGTNVLVRIMGSGGKHRRTLGADAGRIGGILLIGTAYDLSVGHPHGRPYVKVGIGRIGVAHRPDRLPRQFAVFRIQLIQGVVLLKTAPDFFFSHTLQRYKN